MSMVTYHLARIKARVAKFYDSLFPDPDMVRLQVILGASTLTVGSVRRKDRQLTVMLRRSRLLTSERFRRSVIGDNGAFVNDVANAIILQSPEYQRDVVAEIEIDEWLAEQGFASVRWIPRALLYSRPDRVKQMVMQFI